MTAIETAQGEEADMFRLAAGLEQASEHPIAQAIVAAAGARNLALARPQNFAIATGKSVSGRVEGRDVAVGSAAFRADRCVVDGDRLSSRAGVVRQDGATVVLVARDGRAVG